MGFEPKLLRTATTCFGVLAEAFCASDITRYDTVLHLAPAMLVEICIMCASLCGLCVGICVGIFLAQCRTTPAPPTIAPALGPPTPPTHEPAPAPDVQEVTVTALHISLIGDSPQVYHMPKLCCGHMAKAERRQGSRIRYLPLCDACIKIDRKRK